MSQRLLIVFSNVIVLLACHPNRQDVMGKYVNHYEPDAEHYLLLMPNDSFRHFYNGSLGHFVNQGTWGIDANGTNIYLGSWKSFGKRADAHCTGGCGVLIEFDSRELYFSYDEPKEMNFYKE